MTELHFKSLEKLHCLLNASYSFVQQEILV